MKLLAGTITNGCDLWRPFASHHYKKPCVLQIKIYKHIHQKEQTSSIIWSLCSSWFGKWLCIWCSNSGFCPLLMWIFNSNEMSLLSCLVSSLFYTVKKSSIDQLLYNLVENKNSWFFTCTVKQMANVRKVLLTVTSKYLHYEVEPTFSFCSFWMAFCAY